LGCDHIARYLDTRFRPNEFPADFAALIHRKTEGHPLFATGTVQLLVERGDIARSGDCWVLSRPLSQMDLQVPATVRSMIAKQLEVLKEGDRRALEYASVEGEEFNGTVLAGLLGADELDLEERLHDLDCTHRLIRSLGEEELPDGSLTTRYRFAHALYQNLLYGGLLSKRRALLHRQAGEILARCYTGQTSRIAAALATHFERGRDFSRAIHYLTEAAQVAAGRYANAAAGQLYTGALSLVEKLPAEQQGGVRALLYYKRGLAMVAASQYADSISDFHRALTEARAIGDSLLECRSLIALCEPLFQGHQMVEFGEWAQVALEAAVRIQNQELRSEALAQLARGNQATGQLTAARDLYDQSIDIARASEYRKGLSMQLTYRGILHFFESEYTTAESVLAQGAQLGSELRDGVNLPQCLCFLGLTRGNLGQISSALAALHEALEISGRNGAQMVASKVPNCLGWLHRELHDFTTMLQYDRDGLEASRRSGIHEAEANALINLVQDYTILGDFEKARALIGEVDAVHKRSEWHAWRFFDIRFQAVMAEHCLATGEPARATEHALRLLANATRQSTPKYIAVAHKILTEIALARGDDATAEREIANAILRIETRPMPLVAWRCHALAGRLRSRIGDLEGARRAFLEGAKVLESIVSTIADERLRSVFLDALAVREVLSGAAGATRWGSVG